MTEDGRITLGWRLRMRMAEMKINTATELKRRLDAVGYEITSAQLSRILDERPAQVKTALLEALLNVLGGTLNDILPTYEPGESAPAPRVAPASTSHASAPPKRNRKPVRPIDTEESDADAGGPAIHPFPNPKKSTGDRQ